MSLSDYTLGEKALFLSGVDNERMRIINLIAADCNHAEPSCYHREIIEQIQREENE